jgi:ACS family sodium-dependent inorganic phosphate cotransporter
VLLRSSAVWALLTNHLCSNWVLYMLLAWLPSYFHSVLGFDLVKAGMLSAAPWVTMFVVGNLAGVAADKMVKAGVDLTVSTQSHAESRVCSALRCACCRFRT